MARPHQPPTNELTVRISPLGLGGTLAVPEAVYGMVLFAHGSGSSRFGPRNRTVAANLNASGLATLLFDLLTVEEAADRRNVFDIGLLAQRLLLASDWVAEHEELAGLPLGYFGASTGAAAALVAAAEAGAAVAAVVSRGGRPDLASTALARVVSPTLLIVGGADLAVLELNRDALGRLRCEKALEVVPGARHLFEEPGALEEVTRHACDWFQRHLRPSSHGESDALRQ